VCYWRLRSNRLNRYVLAKTTLELNNAVHEREQRKVTPPPDVCACVVRAAALTNKDVACANNLTTKLLHAETLSTAVPSVPGTSYRFLMCHDAT